MRCNIPLYHVDEMNRYVGVLLAVDNNPSINFEDRLVLRFRAHALQSLHPQESIIVMELEMGQITIDYLYNICCNRQLRRKQAKSVMNANLLSEEADFFTRQKSAVDDEGIRTNLKSGTLTVGIIPIYEYTIE